ncbi:MAG TPA: hypothetical protein VL326_08300 [Kofleriaceae bacterium]|nr:hypothetical protein [Kofleriaceae bacterium]
MHRLLALAVAVAALASSARADDQVPPAPAPAPEPAPSPEPAAPPVAEPVTPPVTPPSPPLVETPAQPVAAPIRVAVECEEEGRTKACPAFLLGLIDANKVLLNSPRAGADVIVYATATEVALVDQLHLRFVGSMAGAPAVIELNVNVDTRATDDEQRAQIEPAFLSGIGLYVRARFPDAVKTELTAPGNLTTAAVGSPWGAMLEVAGSANYTKNYRSANTHVALVGRYMTRRFRALIGDFMNFGINRQPPLMLEDGTVVSLDSNQWGIHAGAEAIKLFNDSWSLGVGSYTDVEDPKSQYRYHNRSRAALEWDMFPADDPRGNRLAVFYHLGWIVERYNIRNDIGERFAQYPIHGIDAVGSVRKDKMSFGLQLESVIQLNHPGRRRIISGSPFVTMQLGTHVDVQLSFSITQREFPAPDPNAIDPSDYAQLSRLSYAEPLSISGSLGLSIHWDPSNGVRNDRIESI